MQKQKSCEREGEAKEYQEGREGRDVKKNRCVLSKEGREKELFERKV